MCSNNNKFSLFFDWLLIKLTKCYDVIVLIPGKIFIVFEKISSSKFIGIAGILIGLILWCIGESKNVSRNVQQSDVNDTLIINIDSLRSNVDSIKVDIDSILLSSVNEGQKNAAAYNSLFQQLLDTNSLLLRSQNFIAELNVKIAVQNEEKENLQKIINSHNSTDSQKTDSLENILHLKTLLIDSLQREKNSVTAGKQKLEENLRKIKRTINLIQEKNELFEFKLDSLLFVLRDSIDYSETFLFGRRAYSSDSLLYAREIQPKENGFIGIYNAKSGKRELIIQTLTFANGNQQNDIKGLALSPSGTQLAVMYHFQYGDMKGHILIYNIFYWDSDSYYFLSKKKKLKREYRAIKFSHDEQSIIADDTKLIISEFDDVEMY